MLRAAQDPQLSGRLKKETRHQCAAPEPREELVVRPQMSGQVPLEPQEVQSKAQEQDCRNRVVAHQVIGFGGLRMRRGKLSRAWALTQ